MTTERMNGGDPIAGALNTLVIAGALAGAPTIVWRFGGGWRADVRDNSVMLFLTHNMVELDQFNQGIGFGVYGAITQFQALASANNEFARAQPADEPMEPTGSAGG